MIQPKIQKVYLPVKSDELSICVLDKNGEWKYQDIDVIKKELITFTPEEFEQFKREFGKELLEKAAENVYLQNGKIWNEFSEMYIPSMEINKKSITGVLDEFLKNNKI